VNEELEKKMNDAICVGLGLNEEEVKSFLDEVIERKKYLFPPDIQPMMANIMFIRKEVSHLIRKFGYSKIEITDEALPPDDKDKEFVYKLEQMDRNITDKIDYSLWENSVLIWRKNVVNG
jgi:hypothetical protein